jgi:hypothetical protein
MSIAKMEKEELTDICKSCMANDQKKKRKNRGTDRRDNMEQTSIEHTEWINGGHFRKILLETIDSGIEIECMLTKDSLSLNLSILEGGSKR